MNATAARILKRANELSRSSVLADVPDRTDTCLITCMVLSDVLQSIKVAHTLLSCVCEVRNNQKGDKFWGVGIDRHVAVLVGDHVLLDPAIDQATRPQHGIVMTPLMYETAHVVWQMGQGRGMILQYRGCELAYTPLLTWYLNAPDFTHPTSKEASVHCASWVLEQLVAEKLIRSKS